MSTAIVQNSFPPEVHRSLKHYVYRLIDPNNGETFYVGKGQGNRVFSHASGEVECDGVEEKLERIRAIRNSGLAVEHIIHRHGMDEATAFAVEAALIDAYPGLTNKIDGHGNEEFGSMHAVTIMKRYAAEEAEFDRKTLLITVNQSAHTQSLYEATRKSWVLSPHRAAKAEVILPVVRGMIIGAFVADEWLETGAANSNNYNVPARGKRYEFTGSEAPEDLKNQFVGKKVPAEFRKKGSSNPIRYTW